MKKENYDNGGILTAILYIVVGILFIVFKNDILSWVMTAIGVLFIIKAIFAALDKEWIDAAVCGVIGLTVILGGWLFISVVMIVFGALIAISGITSLSQAIKTKEIKQLIVPVITIIIGILVIVSHWVIADWFFIIFGVIFVINGILELFSLIGKGPEEKD